MVRRPAVHDAVMSRKVPKPLGMAAHGIKVTHPGETLYVSAQTPVDVPSGQVNPGPVKRQAELAMMHVRNIVCDAGFAMDEVVKVTLYLTDLKHLSAVDEVYRKSFLGMNFPARAVVQVAGLPGDVAVAIDAVAVKKGKSPEELLGADDQGEGEF